MKRLAPAIALLLVVATPAYAGGPPAVVTPEPGTIALLAAGLGLVGAGAWWRRRRG